MPNLIQSPFSMRAVDPQVGKLLLTSLEGSPPRPDAMNEL